MLERKTSLGDIRFSWNVIMRIINDAIEECNGKVVLQNYKGKYKSMVAGNNVILKETPEGVDIELFVVIRFGASFLATNRQIINYVYDKVEKVMGERPHSVKVTVTGVQSRLIAKRHIEFTD